MGVRNPNSTDYIHPDESNLLNIHKAMDYTESGEPALRVLTNIQGNILIEGDVNIPGLVTVNSTPEDPVHTHVTEVGTSGILGVPYMPIGGEVDIRSLPEVSVFTDSGNTLNIAGEVTQGTTPWQISGNGTANTALNPIYVDTGLTIPPAFDGEIKNDAGNPIPISKNTTPNSSANPINVAITSALDAGINSSIDSKGRLKVQTQESIFFNTFQYNKETDVWDESTVNGGSAVFNASQGLVDMSVTSTLGSKVVRQTRQVMRYTSGRQNTLTFSVRLEMPVVGVRRRFGLFDGSDGFYFEDSGTLDGNGLPEYAVVLTSTASGSLVKERITRDNWNGDKLDGNGPSGITASPTAQQMISVEYEWYGAGQIVFSYIINGLPRVIHIFNTGNRLLLPWSRTPFLPIRLELENFGGAAGTHHLYQGSNSVLVEGRLVKQGIPSNILTPLAGIDLDKAYTFYPVVSVRMKPTTLEGIILLSNFVCNTLDNTDIYYKVLRNATVNGTWVDNPQPNAFTQYNYTSSTTEVTDGVQIDSGFITAGSAVRVELSKDADLQLGRGSMGTVSDIITIAIAAKVANKKAVASLSWIEQR